MRTLQTDVRTATHKLESAELGHSSMSAKAEALVMELANLVKAKDGVEEELRLALADARSAEEGAEKALAAGNDRIEGLVNQTVSLQNQLEQQSLELSSAQIERERSESERQRYF